MNNIFEPDSMYSDLRDLFHRHMPDSPIPAFLLAKYTLSCVEALEMVESYTPPIQPPGNPP